MSENLKRSGMTKFQLAKHDPKMALIRLFLGKKRFEEKVHLHTCMYIKKYESPLEEIQIMRDSDIHEHMPTFQLLTHEFNLKKVLELGTRDGDSTIAFLQLAHEIDGHVTSIDIENCPLARSRAEKLGYLDKWEFIKNNGLSIEWTDEIDHLFIDSDHSYDHVLLELEKFEPFVKVGGFITLHDISRLPEVLKAVTDYIKDKPHLRLYKYYNNNGLGVIRKVGEGSKKHSSDYEQRLQKELTKTTPPDC
jgi:predicted O-methyltransferase YrrM